MTTTVKYRHEYKIYIRLGEIPELQARLRGVLPRDSHAGENGCYHIRSLYFDNYQDCAFWEKVNGGDAREKFRLRCYNMNFDGVLLEKKSKCRGLCNKRAAPLTREQAQRLIDGDTEWMQASPRTSAGALCKDGVSAASPKSDFRLCARAVRLSCRQSRLTAKSKAAYPD